MLEHVLEIESLARIACELSLAIGIKLFCDNGRIHYRDFVNDFLFWVPGVDSRDATGLERQMIDAYPAPGAAAPKPAETELPVPAAA